MKPRVWLGVFGFGLALVGNGAEKSSPAASGQSSSKSAPAAAPKKEEAMGKIEGQEIKRGAGYMGLELVGGTFKLSFYDAKKKPVAVPAEVSRAALRWPVTYRQGADERAVLNPSADGKSLSSPKVVKPPHIFKLYITLLAATGTEEGGGESYAIDFRATAAP